MRTISITYGSGIVHSLTVPLVAGHIHDRLFGGRINADIRVDTGADVSVVPVGTLNKLGLSRSSRIDRLAFRVSASTVVWKDVFELDFILPSPHPSLATVHVIEHDFPYAVLGVLRGIGHHDVRCNFPPGTLTIR